MDATRFDVLTDAMFVADAEAIADDPVSFPFESMLRRVLLAFARDESLVRACSLPPHGALVTSESGTPVPVNGVIPVEHIASLVVPVCFLSSDPAIVWTLFRGLYARFWCRLQAISSAHDSLLPLCRLFEDSLARRRPSLARFVHETLGVSPLALVLPWLRFAFATLLHPRQTLRLWDALLAFHSLDLLPVLAVGVLLTAEEDLRACSDAEQAREVLEFGADLEVVRLARLVLHPSPARLRKERRLG